MTPNLFLLSAPRSGSSQLAHWLTHHPAIAMPTVKEPNYFAADDFDPGYVRRSHLNDVDPTRYIRSGSKRPAQFAVFRSEQDYAALYRDVATPWRLDASTSYLGSGSAPLRLRTAVGERTRFIVLLRDPVERAISHHGLALRTGRTTRMLVDELDRELEGRTPAAARYLLAPSRYGAALDRWFTAFDRRQFEVLLFEELIADPGGVLSDIFDRLGVGPADIDLAAVDKRNATATARFRRLNRALLTTGVKTTLRRSLPVSWKQTLKRFYFTEPAGNEVAPATRERLEALLADERVAVAARGVESVSRWWPPRSRTGGGVG